MKLENKVAIITGASRGIGAEIAKRFAHEGSSVVVNYRSNKAKALEVVEGINKSNGQAIAVKGDVSSVDDMKNLVRQATQNFGGLDIFVNNAGCADLQRLEEISLSAMSRQIDINIKGVILGTQAAAKAMRDNGRIINISSIAAQGGVGQSIYSATKAAMNSLTKSYALELGPRGITVNAVAPAAVETDLYFEVGLDKYHESSVKNTPLGWIGSVSDVANAVTFFASEDAAWITGEILKVSGGKTL